MHALNRSHADKESQHFYACSSLCQRHAQTTAALFHGRDLEGRGVCNCLNVFVREQVGVVSWNRRELPVVQIRDRLLECGWIDVRIVSAAAITRPPTGV